MAQKMTDTELRRRKKVQSKIGYTTSTMGLAGLGLLGTSAAMKKPKIAEGINHLPGFHGVDPKKFKDAAFTTGVVSSGVGGVGGFNSAKIYGEEAKRHQAPAKTTPVKKSDDGLYGDEGSAERYEADLEEFLISKQWEPVATNYDPEKKRENRAPVYEGAAAGVSAASAGVAGRLAITAHGKRREAKQFPDKFRTGKVNPITHRQAAHVAGKVKALKAEAKVATKRSGKAGVVALGAAAAAAGLHHERTRGSWSSYAKRDSVSPFGVDHTE